MAWDEGGEWWSGLGNFVEGWDLGGSRATQSAVSAAQEGGDQLYQAATNIPWQNALGVNPDTGQKYKSLYEMALGINKNMGTGANYDASVAGLGRAQKDIGGLRTMATEGTGMDKAQLQSLLARMSEARAQTGQQMAGATNATLADLAMQGGMSGGARERVGYGARLQEAQAMAGLGREQRMGEAGIQSEEMARRLQLSQSLPGMEGALAGQFQGLDQYKNSLAAMAGQNLMTAAGGDVANADAQKKMTMAALGAKIAAELQARGLGAGAAGSQASGMGGLIEGIGGLFK